MDLKNNSMLFLSQCLSLIGLLAVLCCQTVFANSDFSQAYEAAQSGDYKKAITLWKPLAEQGDPAAQYALAWMYESGQGTEQDYQQAAYWYEQAAQQGNQGAQYVLATMYSKGRGVPLDQQQAVKWFSEAANQGDAISQFKLGVHFQKGLGVKQSDKESFQWFSKAAKQGHITAQISLGKIYQEGRGVTQDYKLAIYWYEEAAKQGNALAQFQLANMYEYGRGTEQDYQKAKMLYLGSANQYAPSAYKVAEFFELGKTGNIDFQRARKWYTKAANKGNSAAQYKLGSMYQNGTGIEPNIHIAIKWYFAAAKQNHAQASYQLGLLYEKGFIGKKGQQIITQDYRKARRYYQTACKLNYNKAYTRLAFLYENGLGVPVNLQQAHALYQKSTEEWGKQRFQALSKQLNCLQTATTKLFSVAIACTDRKAFDQQIKEQKITAIEERSNAWSDIYFTGAVIQGSNELEVSYTKDNLFASAKYTFVGRDKPELINQIRTQLSKKYGEPDARSGEIKQDKASFTWLLDDGVELTINRGWPDTTTFVTYSFPEHLALMTQQKEHPQSMVQEQNKDKLNLDLF
jgi:TPR repeat protein